MICGSMMRRGELQLPRLRQGWAGGCAVTVELLLAACLRDRLITEPAVLLQFSRERAAMN
jgi:hypothetical protein